ncbi:MAG: cadherin domain-containing protein [Pseudomonadota bacterium]
MTVDENAQSALLTATATDPDGDALTFSIAGVDAADFAISSTTGVISAAAPLDFEEPADNDGDNVYELTVSVSDGAASASSDISITVSDVPGDEPIKISGDFVGGRIGLSMRSAPDYDGDGVADLAIGADKAATATSDVVGYVLFSSEIAGLSGETFSLADVITGVGVEFFVSSLASNTSFAPTEVSAAATSAGDAFAFFDHPLATTGARATTQFFEGSASDIAALGTRVDIGAAPASPLIRSTIDGSLEDADPAVFPELLAFALRPGLTPLAGESAIRPVGDVTGDGVFDFAFAAETTSGSQRFVYVVSGAAVAADADGAVSQSDLSFPDIFEIELEATDSSVLFGQSGDVDNDGFDELIFSSIGPPTAGASLAYVIDGAGLVADADGAVSVSSLPGDLGFRINQDNAGPTPSFAFLDANIVGDLTGDGRAEALVVVSANRSTPTSDNARSEGVLLSGSYLASLGATDVSLADDLAAGEGADILPEPIDDVTGLATDAFGSGVARAFDLDNDNVLELAIGAPFADTPQSVTSFEEAVGAIYVIPSTLATQAIEDGGVIDLGDEF